MQLLLQHSNADYRVGPAKHVLALNAGHRFHHLKWAGAGDVNFGLFTLIWDHLYRTYSFDPARRFTSAELGMAAKPDYPTAYPAQLRHPFSADGGAEDYSAARGVLPASARCRTPDTAGVATPTSRRTRS